MKALPCVLLLFFIATPLSATLLNNPESAVYDAPRDRYLISNYGDGAIVAIDNQGVESYFSQGLDSLAGLEIVGDTVYGLSYQGTNPGLIGYDLATGAMTVDLFIPGMDYLNDIAADNAGNVYMTDSFANTIFRVRLSDLEITTLFTTGLRTPDGILFDEPNNRLLFVNSSGPVVGPVKQIDLSDLTMSRVMVTDIPGLDGITKDTNGYFYLSSWSTDQVYRYDGAFTNPPEIIASGYTAPGDIYFNPHDNMLVIPDFFTSTVEFLPISPTSVVSSLPGAAQFQLSSAPNPFRASTRISYSLPAAGSVSAAIYDARGRSVRAFDLGAKAVGSHATTWDGTDDRGRSVAGGVYFYELRVGTQRQARRMLHVK